MCSKYCIVLICYDSKSTTLSYVSCFLLIGEYLGPLYIELLINPSGKFDRCKKKKNSYTSVCIISLTEVHIKKNNI
ncbi:hypothetical protein EUGRSUZ_F02762 [Eucalyptus grandis]|uniref:Uncharacterized protein n=2 Tax=Eucalyptus grandis TaxID=71139 RepID=A0ACC3KJ51_EUCGR|nr:hypothetical protein EUGRSUZ_F02762 [Eucalyptus grandis]